MCTTDAHTLILFWSTDMELYIQYRRHHTPLEFTLFFAHPEHFDHALTYNPTHGYLYNTYDFSGVIENYVLPDYQSAPEEELFQLMCVWDHKITLDQMIVLQNHLKYCINSNKENHDDRIEL